MLTTSVDIQPDGLCMVELVADGVVIAKPDKPLPKHRVARWCDQATIDYRIAEQMIARVGV